MSDDEEIEFPEPPEEYLNAKFTPVESVTFPSVPNDEVVFPSVASAASDVSVESLEERLRRLKPNTTFTLKKANLSDFDADIDAERHKSEADKVRDLLSMAREEAALNNRSDQDEEPVAKSKPRKDNAVKKTMQDYLKAAEADQQQLQKKTQTDNIFMMPKSNADAEARAKARYDAVHTRRDAKVARQVLRDAKDAGIDPREIDPALYDNAALDSDLEDDGDDDDSDSIELSDSD
jgi:hypothetical protein